jgi:hypothetical protein
MSLPARRRLLTTLVVLMTLAPPGAPAIGHAAASGEEPQYFTWFAETGDHGTLFTVVYNSKGGTFVLDRAPNTGRIRDRFAASQGHWFAQGIAATTAHQVYLSGSDGRVRVYAQQAGGGYHRIARWKITIPGHTGLGLPQLGALNLVRGGYTVVSAILFDDPNFAPVFTGLVVLDRTGRVVGTWAFPDEGLPPNAFLLASAVTVTPSGALFVMGVPCADLACGDIVYPDGFLYRLNVSRTGPHRADVELKGEWSSADLVSARDAAALSARDFVLVERVRPLAGAFEAAFRGGQLTRIADVPSLSGTNSVATNRASHADRQRLWLVEGAFWLQGEYIQRYGRDGSGWQREGAPYAATWGPGGPPVVGPRP